MSKKPVRIVLFILLLFVLVFAGIMIFAEPFIKEKIHTSLNQISEDINIDIEQINVSLLKRSLLLDEIVIAPRENVKGNQIINGTIGSVMIKGIHLYKLLFRKDIHIENVIVSNTDLSTKMPFDADTVPPIISALNIQIGQVSLNNVNMTVQNSQNPQNVSIKEGNFSLFEIKLAKDDTLDGKMIRNVDFNVVELTSISADSNYTFKTDGLQYFHLTENLSIDTFDLQPNFSDYAFANRSRYETDRVDVSIKGLNIKDASIMHFIRSGNLLSTYVKIGYIDLKAFRDKRKEFRHIRKPSFQEMIYNFPGVLNIDSLQIDDGKIMYIEHADESTEAGYISFNNISATITNISNDTIYKTKELFINLAGRAKLMNLGMISVNLKARLFDPLNTFFVKGSLSAMEINVLNPMLENNASIYGSGYVDDMKFNFTANDTKAEGELTLRYHDLRLTLKNKETDDTTALKERLGTFIAAIKTFNANPMPGKKVRGAIIDYQRDPEKFLFNYFFKSVFSGIKYTLTTNPKEKKDEE